jgi:hypothetical protein
MIETPRRGMRQDFRYREPRARALRGVPARVAGAAGALAALTVLSACGGAARLPEGAAYLPVDADLVLALDLPALAATDVYRELQERGGRVGLQRLSFMRFAEATGIDPARDVRWITLVGRGPGAEGPPIDELSALVTGSFDGAKMRRILKESGMPSEVREGVDVFQMVIVDGRCRFCIAVLDDTTAAFGDGAALGAMAAARARRESSLAGDAAARRLLTRVDRRAAIWGVVRGRDLAAPLAALIAGVRGSAPDREVLGGVKDLSFFVIPRETISVALDAVASSEEDALLVADVLEGAGAVGRLALRQVKPDSADLLSTFKVEVDGVLIRASASAPSARLLELARTAGEGIFAGLPGFIGRGGDGGGADAGDDPGAEAGAELDEEAGAPGPGGADAPPPED